MRLPLLTVLPCLLALIACASTDKGKGNAKGDPSTGTPAGVAVGAPTGTTGGTSTGPELAQPVCDLLANPGAESGIDDWTVLAGELAAVGVSGNTPTPYLGDFQFGMGQAATSIAAQTVDLEPYRAAVETGTLVAHLDAQVRTWSGNDEVYVGLTALDAAGDPVADVLEGPFQTDFWRLHKLHLELPAEAVALDVRIGGTRNQGSDNDAYIDALSLCLDHEAAPTLPSPTRGPWLNWVTSDAVSVLWETTASTQGGVEFGPADGDWEDVVPEAAAGDHHDVRLTGLLPDTTYRYRIVFDGEVGDTFSFRTAPDAKVPFRFTVWGDNQDGPDVFAEIVDRMEVLDPDFALAVGDVVQTGSENAWRDQLLDPILDLSLDTPFVVAAGNHERIGDNDGSNFDLHMSQPGDEHCFGWTYAGAYFLIIDTDNDVDSGPQAQCIADMLASPEFAAADVQIAAFHYPPRIEYWAFWTFDGIPLYTGDPEVRDVLEPQFEAAGVDLVLNGHNHLYAYTAPGTYSSVAWVTTGGGGGSIDTAGWVVGDWDMDTTLHDHHFLHIQVDGKNIDLSAVGLDGSVLHNTLIQAD